jgi:hypothetical protein
VYAYGTPPFGFSITEIYMGEQPATPLVRAAGMESLRLVNDPKFAQHKPQRIGSTHRSRD